MQVIGIDLVLPGDNAAVIGVAAAGLEPTQRRKAIMVGILDATVLRIAFATVAVHLLAVIGLLFAGGLRHWVCWKMWRELRAGHRDEEAIANESAPRKTFFQTATPIGLSIALMGIAANLIARMLTKHRWIAYVGLAINLYVSLDMIYRCTLEVAPFVQAAVL
ncbi:TerC family protein [Ensifer sp. ENS07]|uniref:TerC family protein n=1 Tax=Ensifer sp. ENS07 TaxID=2769274 RepID=UPI0017814555|nr:TerC family protein [Ensifer sp. ENS07]MBD9638487.1 TerC family protein [Ensifer sp. ENS07]